MTLSWAKMLPMFIMFENVNGWNSSAVNVTKLQALDLWRLKMEWIGSRKNQTYEIQVGRSTNMDVVDSMKVSGGSLSVYSTVWTSQLPLNCVDHSVRIRLVSDASTFSSWSSWITNYGENMDYNKIQLFPDDQVLREGSTLMFCCIYPTDTNITSLFFGNKEYKVINISPRVKAIRVENIQITNTYGINFYCDRDGDAASNFVTFPPEKPQNFRCETEDMHKACCSWMTHRSPNLNGRHRRNHTLLINDSRVPDGCNFKNTDPPFCCFEVVPQQITYNVTLLVTNSLGRESNTYIFSIRERVFPVPDPPAVTAGVFDSVVILQLNGRFRGLSLICQIELEPGGTKQELDKNGSDSKQHYTFRLQHLKPSTPYSIRGRCAARGRQWGRWTPQTKFITEPLVTLNLWRQIREHPDRTVILQWKTVNNESESNIKAYVVCVNGSNPQRSVCMNVTLKQVEITIDVYVCDISVQAVIHFGLSVQSHITIPPVYTHDKRNASSLSTLKRIMGNEKGFQLTWTRDSATTCDYIAEWCMLGIVPPCVLDWRKVPANQTSLNMNAGHFKAGVQYMFTIYGCNADGHRAHEKQIGYLKEQEPTQYPMLDSNPDITWSSVNLKWSFSEDDPSHTGFITGYVITIHDDSTAGAHHNSYSQSLNDPHRKSFTVSGLEEDQLYTFDLAACTSAGCGPQTSATFRTSKNHFLLTVKVLIPVLVLCGCCFFLWSMRNVLRGFPEEKFGFLHVKALDLDEDLYEVIHHMGAHNYVPHKASEKIHNLRMEDCEWCDVEILDVRPEAAGKTQLTSAEGPQVTFPSFPPTYHLQADTWAATGLTNFTYLSSVPQDMPSEEPETTKQHSEISGFSSDYITSVTM